MRGKVVRGASFRGLLNYLMDGGRGELIGGNMAADTKTGLSAEFGITRSVRPDVAKPVEHIMLSLPPGDELTAEQWRDVASAYLHKMDMRNNQYCIIQHSDKRHQHVHIVANRITQDGGLWYGDREVLRTIEACRQIEAEKDYLRETSDRDGKSKQFRPSYREQGRKRRGQDITRQLIHDAIQRTLDGSPRKLTPRELIEALRRDGIEVRPNISATGRINGFSFAVDEAARYTGAKVGYKWAQLRRRIDYQPARDNAYLMQLIGRRPQEMAFSPAEFAQYAELIDRYIANPTRAIDLRDDIKRIGVSRLLRGVQEMQAAHYEQLAALYEEQRRTWVKIRAQRPPIRLSARDMAGLAVMFAAAPALGALVLLPYVIDRLLRHNRRGRAREISEEIAKMKQEIIRDNQRTDILRELRDGNKKRVEEIKKMEQDERKAICEAVSLKIDSSAQKSKKFGGYVGYINDIGAGKANLTYANMAAMYHRDFWVGNNAVICGTDKMLDAAIVASTERPENGALYVLPIVFDVISKKKVYDTLDAPTLKLEVQSFLADKQAQKNYIDEELAVITAENKSKIYDENKLSEEIDKRLSTMGQALQAPQRRPANIWGNVSVPDAEYQELIKRAQASAMQEAEIKRLDAANNRLFEEKKAETAKNEDLEQKITDIRTSLAVSNAIKDEYAQDNVELSEQNKMLLSYISAQGLNSSLAQWIEERTKTEQAIEKQVAQQQYDGMEM